MSTLAWIRAEARSASPERIIEQLDKLERLRGLGADGFEVSTIVPNRARLLAAIARRSTNQALERRDPLVRHPALYAFCADAVARLTDEVVDLFDQALAQGHARARRELEQRKLAEASAANEKVHLLAEVVPVLIDPTTPDVEVRRRIFELVSPERLARATEEDRSLARPLDDNHFAELERCYRWLREFTPRLLESLELGGEGEAAELLDAVELLRRLNRGGRRGVPPEAPRGFTPRAGGRT